MMARFTRITTTWEGSDGEQRTVAYLSARSRDDANEADWRNERVADLLSEYQAACENGTATILSTTVEEAE